ncbi:MAG: response regulator [bacterium]
MVNDSKTSSRILIVDDVPQNIQVLANILKEAGYQMGFAKDAKTALAHTDSTQFDLILLDIMMPEIDGYDVCARLKEDRRKKDIPVIFITAKGETADKTRGFELGAVDYITKPFDVQEVLARVKTHLTIRSYATRLEQMVEERTRQLVHADRLATLGTFSAAIVHEINNPLSHVLGNAKLLQLLWNSLKPLVEGHAGKNTEGERIREDMRSMDGALTSLLDGCYRISRLTNSLRTYSRQSNAQKENYPLIDIINDALHVVMHKLKFLGITVDATVPRDLAIYGDQQKISQIFINLIDNACDAMEENAGGKITIQASAVDNQIDIRITDNGPGIPGKIADMIFNPFFTTKSKDKGTGLGLFIVKNIVEEYQGTITVSSGNGKGTEFHITLPGNTTSLSFQEAAAASDMR